jgi:hypothetical protein
MCSSMPSANSTTTARPLGPNSSDLTSALRRIYFMAREDLYHFGYQWRIRGPIETVFHYVATHAHFRTGSGFQKSSPMTLSDQSCVEHTVARVRALLPYVWTGTSQSRVANHLHYSDIGQTQPQPLRYARVRAIRCANANRSCWCERTELRPTDRAPPVAWGSAGAFAFNHHWAMRQARALTVGTQRLDQPAERRRCLTAQSARDRPEVGRRLAVARWFSHHA